MLQPFEVQDSAFDGRHTLFLSGELDIVATGALSDVLLEISRTGATSMTLDLGGLTFIDSTGMSAVLFARELSERQGWDFSLIPGSPRIQHVFEVTGLVDALPFRRGPFDEGCGTELSAY